MDGTAKWWQEAVVYQIYPRSFQDSNDDGIGDINGIISRLDYLKNLGVDVIWLSPIYKSPQVDNGYDISDYKEIAPEFGTMEDFDYLLAEAHARGLKIIMDLVVNHTSDRHAWFAESRLSKDNLKRNYYIWRDGFGQEAPNKLQSVFGGSAWQLDETTGQYYLHLFAKEQPDLNWENEAVRSSVYDMMTWWLDKGIDGFRMDVINLISKPAEAISCNGGNGVGIINDPRVCEYLKEMNSKVLSHYDIMTVGETPGVNPQHAKEYAGFDTGQLNMIFQFQHMGIDLGKNGRWSLRHFSLLDLKRILSMWQTELHGKAWNSLYWSNHDQPRAVSRFGDVSTRLYWEKSAKMLAACLHMMQGTPYIYQGEEIGMTNAPFENLSDIRDIEILNAYDELVTQDNVYTHEEMMARIRKNGRDNARTPMQWSDAANGGFSEKAPWLPINPNYTDINVKNQEHDANSILSYYKKLLKLRKENPVIIYGDYELLLPEDERIFAYKRNYKNINLLVVCNFTNKEIDGVWEEILQNDCEVLISNYGDINAKNSILRAYEARVVLF